MTDTPGTATQPSLFDSIPEQTPARPSIQIPELTAHSSFAAAIGAFHPHMLRQGFSDNTIKSFQSDLRLAGKYLGANRALNTIGTQDLQHFLDWLQFERDVPCSPKSYARRLTTLKVFFAWLAASEILDHDPAAGIVHQPVTTPLPIILFDDEVARLVQTSQDLLWNSHKPDARPYVLINLLLQTAMKKGECMRVKLDDLDLNDPTGPAIYIRHEDPRMHHKERKLGLSPKLAPALKQYQREYKPQVFLFECTSRNLEYVLADIGRAAEISKPVSFESLRWTAAVRDYRTGMPPERLRLKLGLSEISWRETGEKIRVLAAPGF